MRRPGRDLALDHARRRRLGIVLGADAPAHVLVLADASPDWVSGEMVSATYTDGLRAALARCEQMFLTGRTSKMEESPYDCAVTDCAEAIKVLIAERQAAEIFWNNPV